MVRNIVIIFVLLLSFGNNVIAQLSGAIRGSLTKANSPYIVTGDIIVNGVDTLRIEPGVELKFNENVSFLIYGKVVISGTDSDSIRFIPNIIPHQAGYWAGIYLDNASNESLFSYIFISGATVGLTVDQCNPKISSSYFNQNLTALDCKIQAEPLIKDNLFQHNQNACIRVNDASPNVTQNRFYYNCESYLESVLVYSTNSSGVIKQNILAFNDMSGIDCSNQAYPSIYNNTIVSNEFGITTDNSNLLIKNNVIFQNQYGLVMENSTGTVSYNDIFDNTYLNYYGVPEGVGFNTTTNSQGDSCDLYYNISLNPQLTDINNFDFTPLLSSPLVDTGDPLNPGNISVFGDAPDIGAIEYSDGLPVELCYFRYNNNKLEWQTASECNNYGFKIWRSDCEDMVGAEMVGFVNGHGNSSNPLNYSFSDPIFPDKNYYYQLEQIDLDGKTNLSSVILVSGENIPQTPKVYDAYPNPFNGVTKFSWYLPKATTVSFQIYNILGQKVASIYESVPMVSGEHQFVWDGKNEQKTYVTSGNYYGVLKIDRFKYQVTVLYIR